MEEFEEAAAALAAAVPLEEPPPELRARTLEATRRRAPVVPIRRAATAVVAIAAVVAVGIGVERALDRGSGSHTLVLVGATGTLVVDRDGRARLVVDRLPAAPAGRTYEAWVVGPHGALPAGTFASGGVRTVTALTRPVPHGSSVAVTVETPGGTPRMAHRPVFHTAGAA